VDLQTLREQPIDFTEKGFAFLGGPGTTAASIAAARPPLHAAGFSYPLLTLHESALHHNVTAMAEYCAAHGVDLAPHGKTAMSPELAARQLSSGAWAITVATIGQLRTYWAFGVNRLLLANELVDEASIAWLSRELATDPQFEIYCYVDSITNIETYTRVARPGKPLPVLVEIGHPDGRTGCRTDAEALAVAEAARASGVLRVAGVAGYEGTIKGEDALEQIAGFGRRLRRLADLIRRDGDRAGDRYDDEDFIVSAGGSSYFDVVTRELTAGDTSGLRVVLRSGAYLYFDHGQYATMSPQGRGVAEAPVFRPAIELWAQVLSRPEPGLALLGFGRRDVGSDSTTPVPLRTVSLETAPLQAAGQEGTVTPGWRITQLSDQHAFLELPADAELKPGDLVGLGISHPCTTLDKWRLIPIVDDGGRVTDVVRTFF
jgi:D-serine deaminase-like pyridoxal phosphate-dependent protein